MEDFDQKSGVNRRKIGGIRKIGVKSEAKRRHQKKRMEIDLG